MKFSMEKINKAQELIDQLKNKGKISQDDISELTYDLGIIFKVGNSNFEHIELGRETIPILLDFYNKKQDLNFTYNSLIEFYGKKYGKSDRMGATGALILLGREIIPKVISLFEKEKNPDVRENLSYILGFFGGEEGIDVLLKSFEREKLEWDNGENPRYEAILSYRFRDLSRLGDDIVSKTILDMFNSEILLDIKYALLVWHAYCERIGLSRNKYLTNLPNKILNTFTHCLKSCNSQKRLILLQSFYHNFIIYYGYTILF